MQKNWQHSSVCLGIDMNMPRPHKMYRKARTLQQMSWNVQLQMFKSMPLIYFELARCFVWLLCSTGPGRKTGLVSFLFSRSVGDQLAKVLDGLRQDKVGLQGWTGNWWKLPLSSVLRYVEKMEDWMAGCVSNLTNPLNQMVCKDFLICVLLLMRFGAVWVQMLGVVSLNQRQTVFRMASTSCLWSPHRGCIWYRMFPSLSDLRRCFTQAEVKALGSGGTTLPQQRDLRKRVTIIEWSWVSLMFLSHTRYRWSGSILDGYVVCYTLWYGPALYLCIKGPLLRGLRSFFCGLEPAN